MMGNYFYPTYNSMSAWMFGGGGFGAFTWLMPLLILGLSLKGIALWKTGRNNHLYWFKSDQLASFAYCFSFS